MRELLVPQTTVITPNSLEARRLALEDGDESDYPGLDECARRLLALGCEYVLITGTHENTPEVVNTLYSQEGSVRSDQLAAFARQLSRLGVHAGLGHRGHDRQRVGYLRSRARRPGVHLANV